MSGLWSFTPKTWNRFCKTMPEITRQKLDCMQCGGMIKPKQKSKMNRKQLRRGNPELTGCSVHRILTQPDEWIIAFFSRAAEHFDADRGVVLNFIRRSLKCTLVHKHKRPSLIQSNYHHGFPMPSEQRPRIFQSDVPFRKWPCVRDGGCCFNNNWEARPVDRRWKKNVNDSTSLKEPFDSNWPPAESVDGGPPPLLIVYWILSDPRQSRLKTKVKALVEQHPRLKKKTVLSLLNDMAERNMVQLENGMVIYRSLGKRWVAVRLAEINKRLREYNRQKEHDLESNTNVLNPTATSYRRRKWELELANRRNANAPGKETKKNRNKPKLVDSNANATSNEAKKNIKGKTIKKAKGKAPHYQSWRNEQITGETNEEKRKRYLELYPDQRYRR